MRRRAASMFLLAASFLLLPASASALAGCTGSLSDPCHMGDVDDVNVNIRSPTGSTSGWLSTTVSSGGNAVPAFEETWEDGDAAGWTVDNASCGSETAVKTDSGATCDNVGSRGACPAPYGTYFMEVTGDDQATKSLDLSAYSNLTIKFGLVSQSMDDTSEYGQLLFYDGSSWHILKEVHNNQNAGASMPRFTYDIPDSWLSSNNKIQLDLVGGGSGSIHSTGNGCGDHGFVDSIAIYNAKTEVWSRGGYSYCPVEGSYDVKMAAHAEGDTWAWENSTYTSSVYSVNYDSSSSWCSCGNQYAGNTYNWLASATAYSDSTYPRCCGDEGSEIWEASGSGNSACVKSETVSSGSVANNDLSYLVENGELHFCKTPGGASKPYSWLTEWYECDYVSTGSGDYYCGAGGTDNAGEWHTLQNSGCQLVERIRGGRIIVH